MRRVLVVLEWSGRAMMTAGVVLLLFVAYQLWGTGIHTRAAQNDLEQAFTETLTEAAEQADDAGLAGDGPSDGVGEVAGASDSPGPAPGGTPVQLGDGVGLGEAFGLDDKAIAALPAPEPSQAAGYISIPAIGSNWWYVEGVDLAWLRDGPGHFPGTPWPGQTGNAALAGHRTTYGAPFHRVDELRSGDEVLVETAQGEFRYEVLPVSELADAMPVDVGDDPDRAHFIVDPDAGWILDDYGDDRITLMACHPKYSAAQRIVVVAELAGEVAPTTPPSPDAPPAVEAIAALGGTGSALVGNDPTARLPALLWAGAAASVWLLASQIGRTWKRAHWPAYVVLTPVFLAVLFGCFVQVERLLPAAY